MKSETREDQLSRLRLMMDEHSKWDLSENDRTAIIWAVSVLEDAVCRNCWHSLAAHHTLSNKRAGRATVLGRCNECHAEEDHESGPEACGTWGTCEHPFEAVNE